MRRSYSFLVLSILILVLSCGREQDSATLSDDPTPIARNPSVAVIGDSIATGVFAPTKVGVWPKEILVLLADVLSRLEFSVDRRELAKRINEKAHEVVNEDNIELRYATTNADWGLPSAIATKHDIPVKDVKRFLAAQFGATTRTAPALLKSLLEQYKKEGKDYRAGYVVLMLGANDFCHELTPQEYGSKLKKTLLDIKESHPSAAVILASLPPIMEIKKIDCRYTVKGKIKMSGKALGKKIKIEEDYELPGGISCDDIRRDYCAPLYRDNANDVLSAFQEQSKAVYSELSTKMDLRYAPIYEAKLTKEQIAFDGFHPNMEGQKLISSYIRPEIER